MPHAVYAGKGALANVKDITAQNAKKIAVFADQGIIGAGLLEAPLNYIKEAGVDYELISDLAAEPTCDQAQDVVNEFRNKGCDFIVAVGGGSDSAHLTACGIPTLCALGVRGQFNHTEREWAEEESLFERTKLLMALLSEL